LEAKEKKRAEEDCFEFLKDLRDVSRDIINSLTIIGVYDPTLMRDGMHCSWYTL
jgi:hypothetical protein